MMMRLFWNRNGEKLTRDSTTCRSNDPSAAGPSRARSSDIQLPPDSDSEAPNQLGVDLDQSRDMFDDDAWPTEVNDDDEEQKEKDEDEEKKEENDDDCVVILDEQPGTSKRSEATNRGGDGRERNVVDGVLQGFLGILPLQQTHAATRRCCR